MDAAPDDDTGTSVTLKVVFLAHLLRDLYRNRNESRLFSRVTTRGLLEKDGNRSALARLKRRVSPEMDWIVKLIMKYGPLEKEAVFLALTSPCV